MTERPTAPPFDPTSAWADPPGVGKALIAGVVVGVAISFVGVGGGFLVAGQGWGTALAMGAFVAMWGGVGFGTMVAGVVWATRIDEEAKAAKRAAREAAATEAPSGLPRAARTEPAEPAATDPDDLRVAS